MVMVMHSSGANLGGLEIWINAEFSGMGLNPFVASVDGQERRRDVAGVLAGVSISEERKKMVFFFTRLPTKG
jgi:hypothetical protein